LKENGTLIHRTAIVEQGAVLGTGVSVGPYAIVGPRAVVGDNCVLEPRAVLDGRVTLGKECRIGVGAVVGGPPQDLKYSGEDTEVIMGDRCTVREYATINRGTSERIRTEIGSGVFIMAYVHIAHDCLVGDEVILANCATLAGHVTVQDQAIVGGLTPVHQFAKVGRLSIVGGSTRITKDVPPFCKIAGNPARVSGLNTVGLSRRNYSPEEVSRLKKAYRIIFRSGINTSQALEKISADPSLSSDSNIRVLTEFIAGSERGICKN